MVDVLQNTLLSLKCTYLLCLKILLKIQKIENLRKRESSFFKK